MVEKHRTACNGGGVALCLKDGIEYTVCHDLIVFKDYMESLFIEINKKTFDTEKDMIIGVIYRIPDTDIKEFNVQLSNILDKMCAQNKLVYLMGDYNKNLLNSSTHRHTGEFVDILYSDEFLPLISRPTRITSNSATLIDNIMINCVDNLNSSINGILVTDISDHFPVFHVNCSVEEINTCSVRRVFSKRNKQAFAEAISETNWCEIYNASDTQESFDLFHSKLIALHNKCFPKQVIKKKYSNRKPWLSDALQDAMRHKNKLYHKYCIRNEVNYKTYRNN